MASLLHTNPTLDFFLFVAVKVVSGKEHESGPLLNIASLSADERDTSYEVNHAGPRLIEVAFPLEQASLASVHEKKVGAERA